MIREIVSVRLENEMDLILANRRTMKLAELCGLSLTTQTGIATAVSEIARCVLSGNCHAVLKLGIKTLTPHKQKISAVVSNTVEVDRHTQAIDFAKRLVNEVQVIKGRDPFYDVHLNQDLASGHLITEAKIETFVQFFKTESPLSPYDEIRKKNIQLLELADQLKESENQYRSLADTLPLMMFVVNSTGKIIYTNQWLKNYFGKKLTTITPFSGQKLIHPDDYPALHEGWNNIFKTGNAFRMQGRLKHLESGAYFWHLITILPVRNDNNAIIQWTGFFVDINAQKIVEETLKDNVELKEARKNLFSYQKQLEDKISELKISNNELEQFANITSHDLQEPLRKIATFSTMLNERLQNLDTESRMYFSKIISSSEKMKNQIKAVLDWSRISSVKEKFLPVDLNEIVESVKSDLEFLMQEKKAIIQTLPLHIVKGVRSQLVQLLGNLISNAMKFCNEAPVIKISSRELSSLEIASHEKLDTSARYAEVTISDNGIGFKQEYSEQIFRIFQRLNSYSQYEGTGIGLAICRKIIENHKGEISATGNSGHGATFTIILPC